MTQGLPEYVAVVSDYLDGVEVLDTYRVKFFSHRTRRAVMSSAGGTTVFSKHGSKKPARGTDVPFLGPALCDRQFRHQPTGCYAQH
jgi:microcin C transport system substrate-binding protein